ncbi:MAG: hypothetical protein U0527_16180 [Candidatus Eisenbacteria bacterium]
MLSRQARVAVVIDQVPSIGYFEMVWQSLTSAEYQVKEGNHDWTEAGNLSLRRRVVQQISSKL